jgi:hypothetical protein
MTIATLHWVNLTIAERVFAAWKNTRVKWAPIPVSLGIGLLCFIQYRRVVQRERERQSDHEAAPKRKYVALQRFRFEACQGSGERLIRSISRNF